jgi:hypothetical protein
MRIFGLNSPAASASTLAAALAKVNGGVVNLIIQFTDGKRISQVFEPARASQTTTLTSSSAVQARTTATSVTRIMFSARTSPLSARDQRAFARSGPGPDVCSYVKTTHSNNQKTRIGELHVASQAKVTGEYTYTDTADSTMSVGAESSGGSSFTADGTVSVDNSIGSGDSTKHTDGWVRYVDGARSRDCALKPSAQPTLVRTQHLPQCDVSRHRGHTATRAA